jgi:hypothetical protein
MALNKSVELSTGVTANYWKILGVIIEPTKNLSKALVALYVDQAARAAGKEPIYTQEFQWMGQDNPMSMSAMDEQGNNPVKIAYEKLKTLPVFEGSQDA